MYTAFMEEMRTVCGGLPDMRKGGNNQHYALLDASLSAFGVFFTQSPSFLAHQREMQLHKGQDNAHLLHTSLSLTDATYQGIRQALGRRTTFSTTFAPSPAIFTLTPGSVSLPSCLPAWNSAHRLTIRLKVS